jgi:hypothetical protein
VATVSIKAAKIVFGKDFMMFALRGKIRGKKNVRKADS